MKEVRIPNINNIVKQPVKIVETSKKRGAKLSFATKVDEGFIINLLNEGENIGKFIDLEVDLNTNILIIHFEKRDKEVEKELAHEMR